MKLTNILYITVSDIDGARFNGYTLQKQLNETSNFNSKMIVLIKKSDDKNVIIIFPGFIYLKFILRKIEDLLCVQSWLYPSSLILLFKRQFWKSDIIHYQLIHNRWFGILLLPLLTRLKPSILTLHDCWFMTGHCVHPDYSDCNKWKKGCHDCPNLKTQWNLKYDTTKLLWKIKKYVIQHSNITLIIPSDWMMKKVKNSDILKDKPYFKVPFGVDTNLFKPNMINKDYSKITISYRNQDNYNEFKNIEFIDKIKDKFKNDKNILFIEINNLNQNQLIDVLQKSDIFLMPSKVESFGMMVIEALACGCTCIVQKNTPMATDFIIKKEYGLIINENDIDSVINYVNKLIKKSVDEKNNISKKCSKFIMDNYNFQSYIKKHSKKYDDIIK